MNRKTTILLIGLLLLFVLVRVPGLSLPYQQDEFKTAIAAETSLSEASTFLAHPPLTALLYRADALIFGGTHLRAMPLLFGLISALLLFYVVRRRFDERAALWSVFLYAISFYGVWSSLMLDTDGAILPTLFLATLYFYDRAQGETGTPKRWIALLVLTMVIGLLVKLSFVLIAGVLATDFIFKRREQLTLGRVAYFGALALGGIVLAGATFALVKLIDPAFNVGSMISHALYYVHWSGRSYLQIIIESIKAVFYLSPLLLIPLLFISKDVAKKASPFLWYLGLGGIFYFILFDFSHGALDKYLMFTIVPLCVLSGAILARLFEELVFKRWQIIGMCAAALVLVFLLFVPQEVVPLYPKTAWFGRVLHGNWNVLTAFNGGSGPVGFYMSFLVIACSFLVASAFALAGRIRKPLLGVAALGIVCTGIAYNAAFIEEFSFGKVYGSTTESLRSALMYIAGTDEIKGIITYNDIGAYELKHMGKYASHFTAAPQFEAVSRGAFSTYKGEYLVVDIPPLYDGFYREFFKSCTVLFMARSGVITSTVYSSCTWTKE